MFRRERQRVDGIYTIDLDARIIPAKPVLAVVMSIKDSPLFNVSFGVNEISIQPGKNMFLKKEVIDSENPTLKVRITNEEIRMDKKKMIKADYIFHTITKDGNFTRIDISVYLGCNTYSSKFDAKLIKACNTLCLGYIEAYKMNEKLKYPLVIPKEATEEFRHKRNYSGVVAVYDSTESDDDVIDLEQITSFDDDDKGKPELNLDLAVKNQELIVDVIRKSRRNYSIR